MPAFEALWAAHVEFGTTKSHKKLLGKKRKRADAPAGSASEAPIPRPKQQPANRQAAPQGEPAKGGAPAEGKPAAAGAQASAGRSEPLANKGRWGSTMAARLLQGGAE